jgi:hypothetical protein
MVLGIRTRDLQCGIDRRANTLYTPPHTYSYAVPAPKRFGYAAIYIDNTFTGVEAVRSSISSRNMQNFCDSMSSFWICS